MNTARNILGKVGLLFVLLVMVLLIAPSVPAPVSAQTPNPEKQEFTIFRFLLLSLNYYI